MKPLWRDAPDFARYLAQDEGGEWYWFSHEPNAGDSEWWVSGGKYCRANVGDWKETLEERPVNEK